KLRHKPSDARVFAFLFSRSKKIPRSGRTKSFSGHLWRAGVTDELIHETGKICIEFEARFNISIEALLQYGPAARKNARHPNDRHFECMDSLYVTLHRYLA